MTYDDVKQTIKRLMKMAENYSLKNFDALSINIKTNSYFEYSKGGKLFNYGIYSPEPLEERITLNCSIGKLIKNPKKGYDFVYYKNKNNEIMMIEKFLSEKINRITYFFKFDDRIEFLVLDDRRRILTIGEYIMENGKIKLLKVLDYYCLCLLNLISLDFYDYNYDERKKICNTIWHKIRSNSDDENIYKDSIERWRFNYLNHDKAELIEECEQVIKNSK